MLLLHFRMPFDISSQYSQDIMSIDVEKDVSFVLLILNITFPLTSFDAIV